MFVPNPQSHTSLSLLRTKQKLSIFLFVFSLSPPLALLHFFSIWNSGMKHCPASCRRWVDPTLPNGVVKKCNKCGTDLCPYPEDLSAALRDRSPPHAHPHPGVKLGRLQSRMEARTRRLLLKLRRNWLRLPSLPMNNQHSSTSLLVRTNSTPRSLRYLRHPYAIHTPSTHTHTDARTLFLNPGSWTISSDSTDDNSTHNQRIIHTPHTHHTPHTPHTPHPTHPHPFFTCMRPPNSSQAK